MLLASPLAQQLFSLILQETHAILVMVHVKLAAGQLQPNAFLAQPAALSQAILPARQAAPMALTHSIKFATLV